MPDKCDLSDMLFVVAAHIQGTDCYEWKGSGHSTAGDKIWHSVVSVR